MVAVLGSGLYGMTFGASPVLAMFGLWGVTALHFLHKLVTREYETFQVTLPRSLFDPWCCGLPGFYFALLCTSRE